MAMATMYLRGYLCEYTGQTVALAGADWYVLRSVEDGAERVTMIPPYIGPAIPDYHFVNARLAVR